jgi:hypothetical protein
METSLIAFMTAVLSPMITDRVLSRMVNALDGSCCDGWFSYGVII